MVTRVKDGYTLELKNYHLLAKELNIILDTLDFLKVEISDAYLQDIRELEVNQSIIL